MFFSGTGKRISDVEEISDPNNVRVYWQKRAWADGNFCREWEMNHFKIVSDKYHLNRKTVKINRLLLLNDHMQGQMTEYYSNSCKDAANAHPW